MFPILSLLCFYSSLFAVNIDSYSSVSRPSLIVNMQNNHELPRKFWKTTDLPLEALESDPLYRGISTLNASASSQFSVASLAVILTEVSSDNVIIVDLRGESHGFLNGVAVSWYGENNWANLGKSAEEVVLDEQQRLKELYSQGVVEVYEAKKKKEKIKINVRDVLTESDVVTFLGASYFRLFATDHLKPTDWVVDQFIEFFRALPDDAWLHFHCCGGKGRASAFMVMYDMLRNAKQVSLDDIFRRQYFLGGKDFSVPAEPGLWKTQWLQERIEFLKQFYLYCRESDPLQLSWSEWVLSEQNKNNPK